MLQLSFSGEKNVQIQDSTLVLFVSEKNKQISNLGLPKGAAEILNHLEAEGLKFADVKKGVVFRNSGALGYKNILVLGRGAKTDKESLRVLACGVYQALRTNKLQKAVINLENLSATPKTVGDFTQALAEGFLLSSYEFKEMKSKPKEEKKPDVYTVHLVANSKLNTTAAERGFETGVTMAATINFSRRLGDMPGNYMTPEILADETVKAAKGTGLKVTVWDKARIKKERMGGLLGVAQGSGNDPRFIVMEYNGAAKSKAPVVFVGKGLTFDSGGISIKPSGAMEEMIYDMCGGANVIGTMLAIARLKLKVNVIGLVPSTENMSGDLAMKPGDIITARNGKTVEVFNTDAEGRLILMDALSYATELKPAAIFDAATLTGAIIVALGNSYTGVFTRDRKLMRQIEDAANEAGEPVWGLPINDHHLEDMKGNHADLCNISSGKGAGSSTAAAFLEQFVDKDIPWAHFDIAGTAWNIGNRIPYNPKKGASGAIIRTFVELAKSFG